MHAGLPTGSLDGPILVLAPHYDDEILGCCRLLEGVADRSGIRVVFACDGRGSAEFDLVRTGETGDGGDLRAAESFAALALLGVPPSAVQRLEFPDGALAERGPELAAALERIAGELKPRWILAPFRFDRHPDHVALARAALSLPAVRDGRSRLLEYFVYYRFRFFPGRDIRRVVRPDWLLAAGPPADPSLKRRALACFTSQVTLYYDGQDRPVLTPAFLDEVAAGQEQFLAAPPAAGDADVLRWPPFLVRLIMAAEHRLKRKAYAWRTWLKRRHKDGG
jgi:LmbE family N-acetylglucosaminyl deacetylase